VTNALAVGLFAAVLSAIAIATIATAHGERLPAPPEEPIVVFVERCPAKGGRA
jgi:hypothetical protein